MVHDLDGKDVGVWVQEHEACGARAPGYVLITHDRGAHRIALLASEAEDLARWILRSLGDEAERARKEEQDIAEAQAVMAQIDGN